MTFHLNNQLGWRNRSVAAAVIQLFYYYFTIGWSQGAGCGVPGSSGHLSLDQIEMHLSVSRAPNVLMAK